MINHQIWRSLSLSENKQKWQNLARLGFCSEHSILPRHHPRTGSTPGETCFNTPKSSGWEWCSHENCLFYGQFPQEAGRLKLKNDQVSILATGPEVLTQRFGTEQLGVIPISVSPPSATQRSWNGTERNANWSRNTESWISFGKSKMHRWTMVDRSCAFISLPFSLSWESRHHPVQTSDCPPPVIMVPLQKNLFREGQTWIESPPGAESL